MKRGYLLALLAPALAFTAVAASGTAASPTAAGKSAAVVANPSCKSPTIGYAGPLTGPNASIGQQTRAWAEYAVKLFNNVHKTFLVRLVEGDTQLLNPAQATAVAQQLNSNPKIMAVVGPAGSPEVEASGPTFTKTNLAFVSGSATQISLTSGKYPTFFRVVPNDGVQGSTDAKYIQGRLKAKHVFIVDDQSDYSKPLADGIQAYLQGHGVKVDRESVSQTQTDYSAVVTKIASDVTYVVLPWQIAANAQQFAQQMQAQGKRATVFGTDGLYQPGQFTVKKSYVSSFAPDIRVIPADKSLVAGFTAFSKVKWGTFGPPVFLATQAAMNAALNACAASGKAGTLRVPPQNGTATRAEVTHWMHKTLIRNSILGGTLSFTPKGDARGAKSYIFQIQDNGDYKLVG